MDNKTQYVFMVNDIQYTNNVIQQWLISNGFTYIDKDGSQYYQAGDGFFVAKRFFQYVFNGNQLIIYAYWKSHKKPKPLKDQFYGWAVILAYKNQLEQLFQILGVQYL